MSALAIVTAASDPAFYARVAYIALRVAQNVSAESGNSPRHQMRKQYARRMFQGSDNVILLAQHVATDQTIAAALEAGPEEPADADIQAALEAIWNDRAEAYWEESLSHPTPNPKLGANMATTQELIEQNVRMLIGDLQLQVVVARAEAQELREQLEARELDKTQPEPDPEVKTNGKRDPRVTPLPQ